MKLILPVSFVYIAAALFVLWVSPISIPAPPGPSTLISSATAADCNCP